MTNRTFIVDSDITVANIIATGNITMAGGGFLYSNGAAYSSGSSYGNTQVASYLPSVGITSTGTTVAIGTGAGVTSQGTYTVAVGNYAGSANQGSQAIAIGYAAGDSSQGIRTVGIGAYAGYSSQASAAVAVGYQAGYTSQGSSTVAIGFESGYQTQGSYAVSMGQQAGYTSQGSGGVAIGYSAGYGYSGGSQGINSIAVGYFAGYGAQGGQGTGAIAIGASAGYGNSSKQGINAIAIGNLAAYGSQVANSIILNASGAEQDAANAGFYVNPVRNDTGNVSLSVYYNTTTKELTYATASGGSTYANANVTAFLSNSTASTGNIFAGNITAGNITVNTLFHGNAVGTTATYTGNVVANKLVTTTGLVWSGNGAAYGASFPANYEGTTAVLTNNYSTGVNTWLAGQQLLTTIFGTGTGYVYLSDGYLTLGTISAITSAGIVNDFNSTISTATTSSGLNFAAGPGINLSLTNDGAILISESSNWLDGSQFTYTAGTTSSGSLNFSIPSPTSGGGSGYPSGAASGAVFTFITSTTGTITSVTDFHSDAWYQASYNTSLPGYVYVTNYPYASIMTGTMTINDSSTSDALKVYSWYVEPTSNELNGINPTQQWSNSGPTFTNYWISYTTYDWMYGVIVMGSAINLLTKVGFTINPGVGIYLDTTNGLLWFRAAPGSWNYQTTLFTYTDYNSASIGIYPVYVIGYGLNYTV